MLSLTGHGTQGSLSGGHGLGIGDTETPDFGVLPLTSSIHTKKASLLKSFS